MTLELTQMLNLIKNFFDNRSEDERYLARAQDVYDLEHRQKRLNRGEAPHQKLNKASLDAWHYN